MQIEIYQLVEGAKKARGLTVIIDVFRAFSLACYMTARGAEKIVPVGNIDTAYWLKSENPDFILVGERDNRKPRGFDFGNSPFEVNDFDFNGKTVIHTTSAGTQGIVNAIQAEVIITGSFVNAAAVIQYIQNHHYDRISLVCMGYGAKYPTEEDTFCAEYIKCTLEGENPDFDAMKKVIRKTSGQRFFNPETQDFCPREDFDLCLNLNAFDFVLKAEKHIRFGQLLRRI